MSGRQDETWQPPEPATPGSGEPQPHARIDQLDSEAQDFGPNAAHLDDEERTDSTPYPAPQPPHQSGPHPMPAPPGPRPHPSGPHPMPPYQSGPHPMPPHQSGPHQVAAEQSGPHSGPHPVGPSGPYYADPAAAYPPPPHRPGYPQPYQHQPGMTQQADPRGRAAVHADELSSARLLKPNKRRPQSGWRKAVFVASGHLINVGESPAEENRRALINRVNQPLRGCYKIAMLSLKGGVGKTTTTTTLGSTFSSLRGDRVIAVDANPDRGTLSQKIPLETTATVRHLLRDATRIKRYSDIRAYTSQGPSRLEVLASDQDPAVSEAFSEDDYRRTITLLEHFYNIVLTDCGTGLMHSAMKGVLDLADSLVIVSSGSVDGARSASATLDWLDVHGYRGLVARSVAVINSVRPRSGSVDLDRLAQHFGARCRAVCRIPFDPHLEEGAEIELDRLQPNTRLALLEMAATVADAFPGA
ncbi:MAG: AAA family ATPase [Labedaea sp.]